MGDVFITELNRVITDIQREQGYMFGNPKEPISRYNRLLKELKTKFPENNIIQSKKEISIHPLAIVTDTDVEELVISSKVIIGELHEQKSVVTVPQSAQTINISIGSLHGNFSLDNLISTIQNSKIDNSIQIINQIKEFQEEIEKEKPDKNKLKTIINKLEGFGEGVISALLVEVGKKYLGLP